jgi:CheY-like chemotaxis protein
LARKVLLADDSVTAQNMGRRILNDAGYEVITVNNGSAALKKIAELKPELVVLDVYMPGYSGLEVCQHIKETSETARIPVLLTVGKLEPFKPDEARRVRADAFIVKPFEASELLTALTKLEDKIVPQAAPQRPGRFAKALAAVEQSETGDRISDVGKGWKDRLIIPPSAAQPHESEVAIPPLASSDVRELKRDEDLKAAETQAPGCPLPAGLPPDVTAEELAAIATAAAAFGKPQPSEAQLETATNTEPIESAPATSDKDSSDAPAATFASAVEAEASQAKPLEAPFEAEIQPAPETVASSEAAKTNGSPTATAEPELAGTVSESAAAQSEKTATADAEVLAAIASLAPTNGHNAGNMPLAEPDVNRGPHKNEEIPVTAAAAVASAELTVATGPRWIAEPVALAEDESNCVLEQEMERAYAALAAVEGARSISAAAAVAGITSTTTPSALPGIESIAAVVEGSYPPESPPVAAAAAAEVTPLSATAAKLSEDAPAAEEEGHRQREAELAAAWANWKQIRESIIGSQLSSQIADAAAAEFQEIRQEEPAPAASEEDEVSIEEPVSDEPSISADSTAIASIVDSVLAELKPKLIEEIARKMSAEKKKKKKE